MFGRKKKRGKRKKHKSAVRKIYKTTDGYLSGRADIKKPRRVAVIHQRKDDGALAVVKIFSKKEQARQKLSQKARTETRKAPFTL